jgi:hypothetical protein
MPVHEAEAPGLASLAAVAVIEDFGCEAQTEGRHYGRTKYQLFH